MKIKFELDLETAQELKKKLSLKQNPIWVKLRKALDKQTDICLYCGQKIQKVRQKVGMCKCGHWKHWHSDKNNILGVGECRVDDVCDKFRKNKNE